MTKLFENLGLEINISSAGIGASARNDLAILNFKKPVQIVGLFTKNKILASPVKVCKEHINRVTQPGKIALIVNSGCANACTGRVGDETCIKIASYLAEKLELGADQIFPFSTGEILKELPEKKMLAGIDKALENPCGNFEDFAEAIMTTDKVKKIVYEQLQVGEKEYSIFGIAKGSGMISPNMATMLAYILTDIPFEIHDFQELHRNTCETTFNSISVDGEMSTNDSFVGVCSGNTAIDKFNEKIDKTSNGWEAIVNSYKRVCYQLAVKIVEDGEGSTRIVELKVDHALTFEDADNVARSIANSPLVKTAIFAGDPNLGRILSAIGACSISSVEPYNISITINDYLAIQNGTLAAGYEEKVARDLMQRKRIRLLVSLGVGVKSRRLIFCDLSYDYVKINAEYRT